MKYLTSYLAKLAIYFLKYADEDTKKFILTESVKHLFCTIDADDILKENSDGTLRFEDKTLPQTYKKDLKEQANLLPNLMLWKVIQKDVEYQLRKKMWEEGKVELDFVWGRLATFLWDIIKTRIEKIKSYRE